MRGERCSSRQCASKIALTLNRPFQRVSPCRSEDHDPQFRSRRLARRSCMLPPNESQLCRALRFKPPSQARNRRPSSAGPIHDCLPRLATLQTVDDRGVAFYVLFTSPISAARFRGGYAFVLAAAVLLILARHGGENIQHHGVDRLVTVTHR